MTNLSTKYLGLKLKNPLVASASPLCREIGNIRKMEDCGASAVVLHEPVSFFQLAGYALIIGGVMLVVTRIA